MNKLWIPALLATTVLSTNAFADRGRGYDERHERYERPRYERSHHHQHRAQPVYVREVYAPRRVIYQAPPVVYRERVEYRERPVYYQPAPRHVAPPRHYQRDERSYDGNGRLLGQTVGAVAGGVIGHEIGHGDARIATTLIGAVVGGVVGGRLADNRW